MSTANGRKPFKGIISKWEMAVGTSGLQNRVHGLCVVHTTYENGIAKDHNITTSPVVAMWSEVGVGTWCETKNSLYLLIP